MTTRAIFLRSPREDVSRYVVPRVAAPRGAASAWIHGVLAHRLALLKRVESGRKVSSVWQVSRPAVRRRFGHVESFDESGLEGWVLARFDALLAGVVLTRGGRVRFDALRLEVLSPL